ncbi:hypothetical protein ETH_00038865, partial [Eimeria tenella]
MPELTVHTGGNASFEDAFYSVGWPAAFPLPASPAAAGSSSSSSSREGRAQQAFAAALTATERLSAACCTIRPGEGAPWGTPSGAPAGAPTGAPQVEYMEGYSFFDPARAWLALTCGALSGPRSISPGPSGGPYLCSSLPPSSHFAQQHQQQQQQQQQQQPYSAA